MGKGSKPLLVSLLNCLYEAQDTTLCKYVLECKRKVFFLDELHHSRSSTKFKLSLSFITLLSQDCLSIGYFLAFIAMSYKEKFRVDLGGCSLGDTGIKIIMQSLCRSLELHSEITGHLVMYIGNNQITKEGVLHIIETMRTTRALRWLDLKNNSICDEGLRCIMEALETKISLFKLNMSGCSLRITEENGPLLTKMLQRNKSLRKLDLSCNKAISDNQASFIIEGLKKNTTLKKFCLRVVTSQKNTFISPLNFSLIIHTRILQQLNRFLSIL